MSPGLFWSPLCRFNSRSAALEDAGGAAGFLEVEEGFGGGDEDGGREDLAVEDAAEDLTSVEDAAEDLAAVDDAAED